MWNGRDVRNYMALVPQLRVYAVDPYSYQEGYGQIANNPGINAGKWNAKYEATRTDLEERYPQRVCMLRLPSVEAAQWIPGQSLDLVWIDADHRYEKVREDIDAWLPKVKPGRYIGGHDYDHWNLDWGVKKAVLETFREERVHAPGDYAWWVCV